MPRRKRVCPRGDVFHVLNRAVARLTLFEKPADYDAFLRVIDENPVRANFVELAEDWVWGSAHSRRQPVDQRRWLSTPVDPPLPHQWRSWVSKAKLAAELTAVRHCIQRGFPCWR